MKKLHWKPRILASHQIQVTSSELKIDNGVEPAESSPNGYKDEYISIVVVIMIVIITAIVSVCSGSF